MNLSGLPKIVARGKKRVGRGVGSGKGGHTAGRGTKGQKARERVGIAFEGTKAKKSFIKRLPLLRGKGKFKMWREGMKPIQLTRLNDWPEKTVVSVENLVKRGWLEKREVAVKIVGKGKIFKKLMVKVPVSKGAGEAIRVAGGTIEELK